MKLWAALAGALALVAVFLAVFAMRRPVASAPPVRTPAVVPATPMVGKIEEPTEEQHVVSVELTKPGTIGQFLVDVGQDVVEGQEMARLTTSADVDATARGLVAAESKVAATKGEVAEASLEAVKAKADAQRAKEQVALARTVLEREKKLMEVGATPRLTLERVQREFETAQAESVKVEEAWRQAENRLYAMNDQVREAGAELEAARKQDAQARAEAAAAEIHAPASGVVVWRRGAEEGKEVFRIAVKPRPSVQLK